MFNTISDLLSEVVASGKYEFFELALLLRFAYTLNKSKTFFRSMSPVAYLEVGCPLCLDTPDIKKK